MTDTKLYLLAEFDVKPELVQETKAIFSALLPRVLEEEGCEAMYTTTLDANPTKLLFFEVFASQEAHDWHMAQSYTHQLANDLEDKLTAPPKMTKLNRF